HTMRGDIMSNDRKLALTLVAGAALGAIGIHVLHAQAKPPVYYVAEIDVTDQDGYLKEFAPKSQAAVRGSGGKFLVIGGNPVALAGDPPKARIVIQQWESMEALKAWFESPAQKELRALQAKFSKVRVYAATGTAQ